MRVLRILVFAGALAGPFTGSVVDGAAALPMLASPLPAPPLPASPGGAAGVAAEPVQAFCGPDRCFARPFWRYRSGAGFIPYRRFGFAPPPPRFGPFGFRGSRGFGGGFRGGFGGRPGGFRRF